MHQIQRLFNPKIMHRIHYLKWDIDGNWSIRYFFTLDARKEYEKHYVLKSHKEKIYIPLSRKEAMEYIKFMAKSKNPVEIYGLRTPKGYKKFIAIH